MTRYTTKNGSFFPDADAEDLRRKQVLKNTEEAVAEVPLQSPPDFRPPANKAETENEIEEL